MRSRIDVSAAALAIAKIAASAAFASAEESSSIRIHPPRAVESGVPLHSDVPPTIQQRGWSSPISYTPPRGD